MTEGTAPIDLVRAAVSFGLRTGIDVNQILADAHLSPMLLSDERSRVTTGQITRVVQELWRSTDDEMFGLGPKPLPRGSFRMICYGMLSAPTLAAALERFHGFSGAVPALPAIRLETTDEVARVSFPGPAQDPDGLLAGMGLLVLHRLLSWAVGRSIPLLSVQLPAMGQLGEATYRMLFGVGVEFGEPEASLEFPRRLVDAPIVRDEAELEAFIAASPAGFLSRPTDVATASDQVRRLLDQGLRAGAVPSAEDAARQLAMSTQTLRRKLAAESTSVRELRENVLRDAAVTSLVQGEESVAALAERLGFSEPSAFTRAFRRWTGSTPGAYRRGGDEL